MLRRIFHYLLLTTIICVLSGCIFFRLSRVLVQLKTPEQYLDVKFEDPVFKARLLQRIIYLSDIETILGKKTSKSDDGYFYLKFKKKDLNDRVPWVIKFWIDSKNLITDFELPKKLTSIITNEVIYNGIKAIGYAEISIGKKRIYLSLNDLVSYAQINQLLGKPLKKIDSISHFNFSSGKTLFNVLVKNETENIQQILITANNHSIEINFNLPK